MGRPLLRPMRKGSGRGRKKPVRKKARRRRAKQTEQGDKYYRWGRRRHGLTNNFTLAVYMQFLVAADKYGMKLSYDPAVDALYIRLIDEPAECEVIRINDQVALNIGPAEWLVGIEIFDASQFLTGVTGRSVKLDK